MKRTSVLAVLALIGAGLATAAGAADLARTVKFDKHGRASIAGSIKGKDTASYAVSGKKGAALSLNFSSSGGACGFDVYKPKMAVAIFQGGTGVGAYSGKFDADGSYSVRIAMRGGGRGACEYHLDVARGG